MTSLIWKWPLGQHAEVRVCLVKRNIGIRLTKRGALWNSCWYRSRLIRKLSQEVSVSLDTVIHPSPVKFIPPVMYPAGLNKLGYLIILHGIVVLGAFYHRRVLSHPINLLTLEPPPSPLLILYRFFLTSWYSAVCGKPHPEVGHILLASDIF